MQSTTDAVRAFARTKYVEPARARHEQTIKIVAGEVHKGAGLRNRVPLVCQALSSRKFLEENRLALNKVEGPPSGTGTRVIFTYALRADDIGIAKPQKNWPLDELRGIAKDVFASLGGGEKFLRNERKRFSLTPDKSGKH